MGAVVHSTIVRLFLITAIVAGVVLAGAMLHPDLTKHLVWDALLLLVVLWVLQLERARLVNEVALKVAEDRLQLVQQIHDDIARLRSAHEPKKR